ncbi:DUF3892 domain-containing protein [Alloalcanivorax xenomutans]|uniref:DUF3892 domain-containing protein n=1 Tax=Alloalcanivorax xenomutans TaxID=1094342 RepID=UPI0009B660B7|nr:DUF3892 domain-containing protein [Alloalcanivorax xenomutans]
MSERRVRKTGKGDRKVITKLCNEGEWWSPVLKDEAINDIERGRHAYYVMVDGGKVDIHVVNIDGKKHLRTDRDGKGKNNLEELPDC